MKFSEKLQTLRKERKMSQEQLADELEVSRQSVSKWESGTTYPEMDKLLGICKIFNCSLDELTNDSITEININTNEKNNINPVNIVIDYFKKMVNVIINMSFNEIIKCCLTMFIVSLFILMLRVPFEFLEDSLIEIYLNFNTRFSAFLISFTSLVINLIYCGIGALIFFYIFKLKYMDDYKEPVKDKNISETKDEKTNDVKEEPNVTIIKNNKNSFIDVFVNIIIYFIKGILFLCSLPFIVTLIALSVLFILSILIISKGIVSIGLILSLLSLVLLNIFGLQIIYYFIFNKKVSVLGTFIIFITSLVLLGVGGGIFTYELTKYKYVDELPTYANIQTKTYTYKMTEDLYINSFHYFYDFEYLIDENLKDEVKLELTFYDNYAKFEAIESDDHIYFETVDINPTKVIDNIMLDISNKTIYNYNKFADRKVVITSSKKNIDKLKENYDNYVKEIEVSQERYYINEIYNYQNKINNLELEIDRLEEKILEKDLEIEEKENKINEYKEKISGLLE